MLILLIFDFLKNGEPVFFKVYPKDNVDGELPMWLVPAPWSGPGPLTTVNVNMLHNSGHCPARPCPAVLSYISTSKLITRDVVTQVVIISPSESLKMLRIFSILVQQCKNCKMNYYSLVTRLMFNEF